VSGTQRIEDSHIIFECVRAAANGPFFPEWEFHSIFGLRRDDLRSLLETWSARDESKEDVRLAINNSMLNLLGYPHSCERAWADYISVPRSEVARIFEKWRSLKGLPMPNLSPTSNDHPLWQISFSSFQLPTLQAALDLELFESLAKAPASAEQLAERMQLNMRAIRAMLPALASLGLLAQRQGQYHLTDQSRDFLLCASPFYVGNGMEIMVPHTREHVVAAARAPESESKWELTTGNAPKDSWSAGKIDLVMGKRIAAFMHGLAVSGALVAAKRFDLTGTKRLLDVGAGSGVFSIAFAEANPGLHCTIMELETMCQVSMSEYVSKSSARDRIDAKPLDMLRQEWPQGYDAMFFSNIFHDWDFQTCRMLAGKAFAALPAGGRILLHEMLLDDTRDGPLLTTLFSMYMLIGTKGQQFTAPELADIVTSVGFVDVQVTPAHGNYAVVSAQKP
jgi:O-methyltransferase domain/Dimerisation domain